MARLVSHFTSRIPLLLRTALALLLWSALDPAAAKDSYSWPADLTDSPFNCTEISPGAFNCSGGISFSKKTTIAVTEPIKVTFNDDVYIEMADIGSPGVALLLDVKGSVTFAKNSTGYLDIKATKDINIGMNSDIFGDVTSTGDDVSIEKNSTVNGDVEAKDELSVGMHGKITGTCKAKTVDPSDFKCGGGTAPSFDHIMISHGGTGVTCTPSILTIKACKDADSGGTCTPYTGGVSGIIRASSTTSQDLNFSIPNGSSEATVSLASTKVATFTLSSPDTAFTCWNGTTNSCQHEFEQAGFVFTDILNHSAGIQQTSRISAVSTKPGGKSCVPAFTSTTNVTFNCTYTNPESGSSLSLAFGATTTTFTCGGNQTIPVPFDSTGKADFKLTYPDVGSITLKATVGSDMQGQDSFITAPASFKLTPAENPIRAGQDTNVTIEAMTAITDLRAKSFGLEKNTPESVKLTFKRCQPSASHPDGTAPDDGNFTSTSTGFANGQAIYKIKWTEVGNGDLNAALVSGNYLGSSLAPTGTLGSACAAGADGALASVPHHFKTQTEQPIYAYSDQPMNIIVSAHDKDHNLTRNYYILADKSSKTVKPLTLGAWKGTDQNPGNGAWNATSIPLADMKNGTERGKIGFTRTYKLGDKLTAPVDAAIRVSDGSTNSSGAGEEVVTSIRNGRLRLSNAFGSIKQSLSIPVMAQYWSGSSWILNTDDNYTTLPLTSIALTRSIASSNSAVTENKTIAAGQSKIVISPPGSGTSGTVDVAVNLGDSTGQDISCLPGTHPTTVGNKQPWLRHAYGSCGSQVDPSARATFGVYPGQTKRTIYVREAFD